MSTEATTAEKPLVDAEDFLPINGTDYVETLDFISLPELRGHEFPFQVRFAGDTLIQQGHEKVEEAGIDRYILEKYIRIENEAE